MCTSTQRGASTLEVIAAIAIFALAAAGLSVVLPMTYGRASIWNLQFKLARVLETQLEDVRYLSFDDIATGDTGWVDDGDLQIRRVTTFVEPGTDISARPTWVDAATGTGNGLHATYYDNINFTGQVVTRMDPNINFNWGKNAPFPSFKKNTFSVRWTGSLQIPRAGNYTFFTQTTDGVRLWINNQLVIDHWHDQNALEWGSGPMALPVGMVSIRMEMYEDKHDAMAILRWQGPSIPKQVISPTYFYTGTTKMTLISVRPLNQSMTINGRVMHFQTGMSVTTPSANISLSLHNNTTATTTNTLRPWFLLANNDDSPLDLSDMTIRYYYTVDGLRTQYYYCDHAGIRSGITYQAVTAYVSGSAIPLIQSATNADHYVEIRFGALTLPPGASIELQGRIWKSDWSYYTQTNDYSFAPASGSGYMLWNNVTVYQGGQRIWGTEP